MLSPLAALRPEAVAWLTALSKRVGANLDPGLLELLRVRIGRLVGSGTTPALEPTSDLEHRCLALAEQFVIDVSGTDERLLAGLSPEFTGDALADLVRSVFVVEYTQRLDVVTASLLDAVTSSPVAAAADGLSLKQLLDEFQAAVMRGSVLDPMTAELVRLRCARTHDCRICQTLRLGAARDSGVDEPMTAKIDFYERSDLPERAKLALRVTDAVITGTGIPSDALRGQARATFTAPELASLCLEIAKWSTQKIHVALGTDGAERLVLDENGVSFFDFDAEGAVAGFRRV